jgi:hypothetical protein
MGMMFIPGISASYRLYALDGADSVVDLVELYCRDDREALTRAAEFGEGRVTELWRGTKRIGKLPARPRFWPSRTLTATISKH